MASYKIYFLNFCHQNWTSISENHPVKLHFASNYADFLNNGGGGIFLIVPKHHFPRGTF